MPAKQADLVKYRQITLLETLDRVLNKGIVLVGEVTLSVADVDLIFLGLQVILTSVETAKQLGVRREE
ncbi:MAG: gas vesicle protein [candidate division NC10 bacterium]|nr:gas vesicle protein [candidate division NC10 bacterium]